MPKKRGINITCDTAPPYFLLNELAIENYRTFSKAFPPLRTEDDRLQIIRGYTVMEQLMLSFRSYSSGSGCKRLPFNQAEFGGVGLETLLTLNFKFSQKL